MEANPALKKGARLQRMEWHKHTHTRTHTHTHTHTHAHIQRESSKLLCTLIVFCCTALGNCRHYFWAWVSVCMVWSICVCSAFGWVIKPVQFHTHTSWTEKELHNPSSSPSSCCCCFFFVIELFLFLRQCFLAWTIKGANGEILRVRPYLGYPSRCCCCLLVA